VLLIRISYELCRLITCRLPSLGPKIIVQFVSKAMSCNPTTPRFMHSGHDRRLIATAQPYQNVSKMVMLFNI
jgi:hypothetical protein